MRSGRPLGRVSRFTSSGSYIFFLAFLVAAAGEERSDLGEAVIIPDLIVDLRRDANPQAAVEQHDPGADVVLVENAVSRLTRRRGLRPCSGQSEIAAQNSGAPAVSL